MKKKILLSLLMLSMFVGGAAVASSVNGDFKGRPIVKIVVNGKTLNPEVPAYIEDGNTMIPLKAFSLALGADVQWDPNTYTVTTTTQKKAAGLTPEQLSEISKYVAKVYAVNADGQVYGQGSGFLIAGGILVTNEHVGGAAKSLRIELNGQTYTTSDVLFKDSATDVMGIRVNASGGLPYNTELPAVDEHVYAIGYPLENFKITEGKILGVRTYSGIDDITHSAITDHGESGAPLINDSGEVVGIVSGIYKGTDTEYAEPMKYVQKQLDQLK